MATTDGPAPRPEPLAVCYCREHCGATEANPCRWHRVTPRPSDNVARVKR